MCAVLWDEDTSAVGIERKKKREGGGRGWMKDVRGGGEEEQPNGGFKNELLVEYGKVMIPSDGALEAVSGRCQWSLGKHLKETSA